MILCIFGETVFVASPLEPVAKTPVHLRDEIFLDRLRMARPLSLFSTKSGLRPNRRSRVGSAFQRLGTLTCIALISLRLDESGVKDARVGGQAAMTLPGVQDRRLRVCNTSQYRSSNQDHPNIEAPTLDDQ